MTKKSILVSALMLLSLLVQAKDYTIVVRGNTFSSVPKTEVTITVSGAEEIVTVEPSDEAIAVCVVVRDAEGQIVMQQWLAIAGADQLTISSDDLPEGYTIQILEDDRVVYEANEECEEERP